MRFLSKTLLSLLVSVGFISQASAVLPGFYVGFGAGPSKLGNSNRYLQVEGTKISPSNSGAAERLFFGYVMGPYGAFEMGYTHYGNSTYSLPNFVTIPTSNPTMSLNSIDFNGKLSYQLGGFSPYAKLGLAIMRQTQSGSLPSGQSIIVDSNNYPANLSNSPTTAMKLLLGAGVGYDVSQNWMVDLSFTQSAGGGDIKSSSIVLLSLSYHFVDTYCGQFLC